MATIGRLKFSSVRANSPIGLLLLLLLLPERRQWGGSCLHSVIWSRKWYDSLPSPGSRNVSVWRP